jgi:hypothetical protein
MEQSGKKDDGLAAMMKLAGSKLGMTPDELGAVLADSKKTGELLDRLGARKTYDSVKNDPGRLGSLVSGNPEAKKLLRELLGGQKN